METGQGNTRESAFIVLFRICPYCNLKRKVRLPRADPVIRRPGVSISCLQLLLWRISQQGTRKGDCAGPAGLSITQVPPCIQMHLSNTVRGDGRNRTLLTMGPPQENQLHYMSGQFLRSNCLRIYLVFYSSTGVTIQKSGRQSDTLSGMKNITQISCQGRRDDNYANSLHLLSTFCKMSSVLRLIYDVVLSLHLTGRREKARVKVTAGKPRARIQTPTVGQPHQTLNHQATFLSQCLHDSYPHSCFALY